MVQVDGARIRAAREHRGLTQGQLAYKASTTVTQISRLENGQRPGTEAVIVGRIAAALGVTVDYLLGLADDSRPAGEIGDGLGARAHFLDSELHRLLEMLPEFDQEAVFTMARTLAVAHATARGIDIESVLAEHENEME